MPIGSPQWMYASGEDFTIDQSLKFNDNDSAYLSFTPASAGNRDAWTFSCWFKIGNHSGDMYLFSAGTGNSGHAEYIRIQSSGVIKCQIAESGALEAALITNAVFRDSSAWYHAVMVYDSANGTAADRLRLYVNGERVTSFSTETTGTQNQDSYFINTAVEHTIGQATYSDDSYFDGHMAEVHFIDGTALTPTSFGETGDYGEWKPKEVSGVTYGTNGFYLPFKNDYEVEGFSAVTYKGNGATQYIGGVGFQPDLGLFKTRDHTNWWGLHDTIRGGAKVLYTNATDLEYTNATEYVQSFSSDGYTVGLNPTYNQSGKSQVVYSWDMGTINPTGFGIVTASVNAVTQSIGNVGFQPDLVWIKVKDRDASLRLFDAVRGGANGLLTDSTSASRSDEGQISFDKDGYSITSAHPSIAGDSGSGHNSVAWCWNMGGTSVANTTGTINSTVRANPTYGQSIVSYTGNATAGATVGHGLSSAPEVVITKQTTGTGHWQVLANGTVGYAEGDYFYLNDDRAVASSVNVSFVPTSTTWEMEAGQQGNVANTQIAYCFHSVTGYSKFGSYTGNGGSGTITVTTGFRPAWIMVKRTDSAADWTIFDTTRQPFGDASQVLDESLAANLSNAVGTNNDFVKLTDTSFIVQANDYGFCNASGGEYFYMAFAGGEDSRSTYNTTGTIDSRVKASTTYGQSVVSYTGTGANATIGHGLSSAPEMVITKRRDSSGDWDVWHTGLGDGTKYMVFDTGATYTASNIWNSTVPSSTVVSLGTHASNNASSGTYIAYCFHSVTGYSKFGSYEGTDSTHTVTLGFKPAFLMIKNADASSKWVVFDNTRSPTNNASAGKQMLRVNTGEAEQTKTDREPTWLDTGFSIGDSDADTNSNGDTFIYMAFADKREYAYWLDQSGNNNDWTSNNLTESDISVDSPTNNFATLNPVDTHTTSPTLSEGNLDYHAISGAGFCPSRATIAVSSGKWYAEYRFQDYGGGIGIITPQSPLNDHLRDSADVRSVMRNSGGYYYGRNNGGAVDDQGANDENFATGDIIGVALDLDNGYVYWAKNNVWIKGQDGSTQGVPTSGSSGTGAGNPTNQKLTDQHDGEWTFMGYDISSAPTGQFTANFGQDSSFAGQKTAQGNQDGNDIGDFYYTPPTGFLALCTSNLADVAVTPSEHFNTVLWTGTTSVDRDITGIGFDPSLVWIKSRSDAYEQLWFDKVRGAGERLMSHNENAESTNDSTLNAFITDGFTLGNGSSVDLSVNGNTSKTYVAWNWKAASTASGTTTGSGDAEAYSARYNTDAGFSIITYIANGTAGQTIPHHLGAAPDLVIVKARTQPENVGWMVYHSKNTSEPETDYFNLSTSDATSDSNVIWNDTAPTSSVFTIGLNNNVNADTYSYIAYCWRSIDGYSKFGSYTGNSNADGTFVYTGFKPAFVIIKKTDGAKNWSMYDNKRDSINPNTKQLYANLNNVEYDDATYTAMDFVSNGFKWRTNNTGENVGNYIYLAFAETPFKYSNAE